MAEDIHLESWAWLQKGTTTNWEYPVFGGWFVTGHDGLQPVADINPSRYVGRHGTYIPYTYLAGLEPSVTLTYGHEDVHEVAKKVAALVKTLPNKGGLVPGRNNLKVKTYGGALWWELPAMLRSSRVEYESQGHLVHVTLEWVSTSHTWFKGDSISGGFIGEEIGGPW